MLNKFTEFFGIKNDFDGSNDLYDAFCNQFGGQSFGEGLFNTFSYNQREKWNKIIGDYFPQYNNRISVIGYDWLGRCFAKLNDQDIVKLFEIGTGEVINIGCSLEKLLDEEIPVYSNDSLAHNFFNSWKKETSQDIPYGSCVGYKVPLFLGGKDNISNLELSDMEVYWTIVGQLLS